MEISGQVQDTALTVQQVADLLKVNVRTVYRLASKGELPGFRVAGTWRFMSHDVSDWIVNEKERARQADARGTK